MSVSKFPKRPVQVPQKSLWHAIRRPIIGCGCIAPLGLFVLVVLFGVFLQVFDSEGVARRSQESAEYERISRENQQAMQHNPNAEYDAWWAREKAKQKPTPVAPALTAEQMAQIANMPPALRAKMEKMMRGAPVPAAPALTAEQMAQSRRAALQMAFANEVRQGNYGAIAQQVQAAKPNKTPCELAEVAFLEASVRMNRADQSGNETEFDKWYKEMNRRADKQLEVCK